MYESLQYPLLFFHGEPGWSPEISNAHARQRLLCETVFRTLSIVAQEWACDAYSRQEDNVLDFIAPNRCQRRITLPTSFHASPANRKINQLDAMSVVTRKGKPHLMITMTCNSNWPEI
ncbi:unnamed protein product, partial [Laminaria digitata]